MNEDSRILAPNGRPAGKIQPLPGGACPECRADKKCFRQTFSLEVCMKCGYERRIT